jgi:hypothetical protein
MRVLIFNTTLSENTSNSTKNFAKYDQKYLGVSMYSTRYSCQILMKR